MRVNLYCAFDKISQKSLCVMSDVNDGMVIRNNAQALSKALPLGDVEIRFIGTFDDSDMSILPAGKDYRVVSWDSYKFPENPFSKKAEKEVENER